MSAANRSGPGATLGDPPRARQIAALLVALAVLAPAAARGEPAERGGQDRERALRRGQTTVRRQRLPMYEHDYVTLNGPHRRWRGKTLVPSVPLARPNVSPEPIDDISLRIAPNGVHQWDNRESKKITVGRRHGRLVRTEIVDSPIDNDGYFTRTITDTVLPSVVDGGPSSGNGARRVPWSAEDAHFLFSKKRIGPKVTVKDGRVAARLRLFAPYAEQARAVLEDGSRIEMKPDHSGVWQGQLIRDADKLLGSGYHFELKNGDRWLRVNDPNAHLATKDVVDGEQQTTSRFADLSYDWKSGEQAPRPEGVPDDAEGPAWHRWVVQEAHVKDLSAHSSSPVEPELRGTYLGAAADKVLAEFHGRAMEFMPVSKFSRFFGGHWGYATEEFKSPEPSYAKDPKMAHRELMEMIDSYRAAGNPVILDVVFNHTANTDGLHFKLLGKDQYYRLTEDGGFWNGSGTGNELATERPMGRKMVLETLKHFVEHYRVDGFRFDLGALIDPKTMREIDHELREIKPDIFLTMEPWSWQRARFDKNILRGALADTNFTVWNGDYRRAAEKFVRGHADEKTRKQMMWDILGSVNRKWDELPDDFHYAGVNGFTLQPKQSVPYIASHDEFFLASSELAGQSEQRNFMANLMLLTSQGVPMLHAGQGSMHDKHHVKEADPFPSEEHKGKYPYWKDSYNQDNAVSWLDYNKIAQHRDLKKATDALVLLRNRMANFHYDRPLEVGAGKDVEIIQPWQKNGLGYLLRPPPGKEGKRSGKDVLVLLNADPHSDMSVQLPAGEWTMVANGHDLRVKADEGGLGIVKRTDDENREFKVGPGAGILLTRPTR